MDPQQNPYQPPSGPIEGAAAPAPVSNLIQQQVSQYAVTPQMAAAQALGQANAAEAQDPILPTQSTVVSDTGPTQKMAAPKSNRNSTQNTLLISEIRDGIVIMSDGSFRSVIMTKTINFDLMSPQEREAVEYSFQNFLNSLYFPVQIFIRSAKVDIQPYIQKLDKIRSEHDNMLLALLMEDYIEFINALAKQTNIMDKKFYVVVPYTPPVDAAQAVQKSKSFLTNIFGFNKKQETVVIGEAALEKAKTELRQQVQAVLNGLIQMGIQALPLDTQELIELYYDVYNPDTATRQQIRNFNDLSAPIVTKGQGQATQPSLNSELGA